MTQLCAIVPTGRIPYKAALYTSLVLSKPPMKAARAPCTAALTPWALRMPNSATPSLPMIERIRRALVAIKDS